MTQNQSTAVTALVVPQAFLPLPAASANVAELLCGIRAVYRYKAAHKMINKNTMYV